MATEEPLDFQKMPKVELHRHLEGSIRLQTLLDFAQTQSITLPLNPGLRSLLYLREGEPLTINTILAKFDSLRMLRFTPHFIQRITREAVEDAAADNILHLELRFSPGALDRQAGYGLDEVMDWVCETAQEAGVEAGIQVRLITCINREESLAAAEELVQLSLERMHLGITGLDLVGSEGQDSVDPFIPLLHSARMAGLYLTIHAGEWGGAANVRKAIEEIGVERIGHGIRVLEDPEVTGLAHECDIPFEVCISSNRHSTAIGELDEHPFSRMLMAGLNVTINTDTPEVTHASLGEEYRTVCEDMGLTRQVLAGRILAAARAAFLPPAERAALAHRLRTQLTGPL